MTRFLAALALLATAAAPALAQQPAAPPAARPAPAPDPKLVAAQQAFEALPEAERRAIQQDLGFAAAFNGAAQGAFGPLTFNAIQGFERDNKLAVDGILAPPERQALAKAAAEARARLRFALLDDRPSGARIGIPQAVFTKREGNATGGSRWQSADGKATLDTLALPKDGETLQQLFDKATAVQPNRKVTYKLLRPDFFVVTAETQTGKSYRRVSLGPDGALRGFAVGYDKALAGQLDRLVITVANSFDAFPAAATATAAAGTPATPPPAAPRERLATGLVLEGGHLLTAAAAMRDCKAIAAGSRRTAARLVNADAGGGLALLKADGLPRPAGLTLGGAADGTLVAIGQSWSGAAPTSVFAEALATGPDRIAAPLQAGGAGAALFDGSGALVGVVTDDPGARRQIAGVVPAARYRFAGPDAIGAALRQAGISTGQGAPMQGGVAAARRESVTPIVCTY